MFLRLLNKIQGIAWNTGYVCRILKPGIPKASCLLRCKMEFDLLLFRIFYFIKSMFFWKLLWAQLEVSVLTQAKTLPISALSNLTPIQNSNLHSPQHVCFPAFSFDNFEAANNQSFMESIKIHIKKFISQYKGPLPGFPSFKFISGGNRL